MSILEGPEPLRKFASAMRRALPDRSDVDLYWGLRFALAMAHQTIRDSKRLTKSSEGLCDLNDVTGVIDRIVAVSVMALTDGTGRRAGIRIRRRCGARRTDKCYESPSIARASVGVAIAAPRLFRMPAAWVTSSALLLARTPLEI